jgi:hypothetical protein
LDVLDVNKRDVTEQAKRLFVNVITVRVSSEVVQDQLKSIYKVLEVNLTTSTAINNSASRPGDPYWTGVGSFTLS